MQKQPQPSQTAVTAAAARAAHLIVDQAPAIFEDRLAAAMLGEHAEEFISYHRHGEHPVLSAARAQVTCRSRYTENRLADAVTRGTTQYVILGAGLDSFAYRSALAGAIRVFEVNHPATQDCKRVRLSAAGIPVPGTAVFVPADFEHGSLVGRLRAAGFDPGRPAIGQTLAEIGGLAAGTELITDYMLPPGLRDAAGDSYAGLVGPAVAQRGEPWLTCLAPDEMSALLASRGFGMARHVSQRDSVSAALWDRSDTLHPISLSMLAHGTVLP